MGGACSARDGVPSWCQRCSATRCGRAEPDSGALPRCRPGQTADAARRSKPLGDEPGGGEAQTRRTPTGPSAGGGPLQERARPPPRERWPRRRTCAHAPPRPQPGSGPDPPPVDAGLRVGAWRHPSARTTWLSRGRRSARPGPPGTVHGRPPDTRRVHAPLPPPNSMIVASPPGPSGPVFPPPRMPAAAGPLPRRPARPPRAGRQPGRAVHRRCARPRFAVRPREAQTKLPVPDLLRIRTFAHPGPQGRPAAAHIVAEEAQQRDRIEVPDRRQSQGGPQSAMGVVHDRAPQPEAHRTPAEHPDEIAKLRPGIHASAIVVARQVRQVQAVRNPVFASRFGPACQRARSQPALHQTGHTGRQDRT